MCCFLQRRRRSRRRRFFRNFDCNYFFLCIVNSYIISSENLQSLHVRISGKIRVVRISALLFVFSNKSTGSQLLYPLLLSYCRYRVGSFLISLTTKYFCCPFALNPINASPSNGTGGRIFSVFTLWNSETRTVISSFFVY